MIHLALALVFWFTMPTLNADSTGCASMAWPLEDLARAELLVTRQSEAWQDSSSAMLADSLAWRRLWPTVIAQAARQTLRSKSASPGARDSIEAPSGPWLVYGVAAVDNSGNYSCAAAWSPQPGPNPLPARARSAAPARGEFRVRMLPAPATSSATIEIEPDTLAVSVEAFDILGRRMLSYARVRGVVRLDVRRWPTGLYLIRARADRARHGARLIVIH